MAAQWTSTAWVCALGRKWGDFFFFWDSYSDLVTFSDLVFLGDFFGDFFVDLFSWFLNGNFWVFDFAWKDRDMES